MMIGIETDRGLWVSALAAAGYQVWAINPMAAPTATAITSRARNPMPGTPSCSPTWSAPTGTTTARSPGTPDAEAIKVLARTHQSLIWARTRHANMLRSGLREYYPAPWRPSIRSPMATRWPCWVAHPLPNRAPD